MLPIPPDNIITMIQKSVFAFVWNRQRDRISRKTALRNIVKGGLGVPDIKQMYYCVEINVDKKIKNQQSQMDKYCESDVP